MDPTTPAGVAHIARLARLALTEEESGSMVSHLGKILAWVGELNELDTEGVSASLHDRAVAPSRTDVVQESLPREEALRNAPARDASGFVVPAVLAE